MLANKYVESYSNLHWPVIYIGSKHKEYEATYDCKLAPRKHGSYAHANPWKCVSI